MNRRPSVLSTIIVEYGRSLSIIPSIPLLGGYIMEDLKNQWLKEIKVVKELVEEAENVNICVSKYKDYNNWTVSVKGNDEYKILERIDKIYNLLREKYGKSKE